MKRKQNKRKSKVKKPKYLVPIAFGDENDRIDEITLNHRNFTLTIRDTTVGHVRRVVSSLKLVTLMWV